MRITRSAVVAVFVVVALCGPGVSAQSRGLGRINGTITSEAGEPVGGAVVKIGVGNGDLEGKSDGSGHWVVTGLGKGQFTAEISKEGFETKKFRLNIEKESMQSAPIKVALKKV